MMNIELEIRARLQENVDEGYKAFHAKLVPNISPERVLGVRLPVQRSIAKSYKKDPRVVEYMAMTHHDYVEELNICLLYTSDAADD